MGLFSRKKEESIDITSKCKGIYQEINKVMQNANNEGDMEIRLSLLQLAVQKYDDILVLIDEGAKYDRSHFASLKANVEKEIEMYKGL